MKRITGDTNESVNLLQHEQDVLDALLAWHERARYTDPLDLGAYAGEAGPTVMARQFGLMVIQPWTRRMDTI